jgi:hypothetical protein
MKDTALAICCSGLMLCCADLALGQQGGSPTPTPSPATAPASPQPAKSTPQIEAGEPRANSLPSADDAPATEPPAGPAPRRAPPKAAAAQKGPTAADRLNLNTATVTGDREQPKVMYVVPWKSPSIGDLSGKPMNSLLDEALAPVDRAEFKREVAYYDAVRAKPPGADAPKTDAAAAAAKQVER